MDIHLHDWRTKPILCKDLCAILTTVKSMFHMFYLFFLGGSGYLKSQTEHPGLLKIKKNKKQKKNEWTWKHEITPQSKTNNLDKCTVIQMTFGTTPPIPTPLCLKIHVLLNCNWSDVRCRASSMSTPWGKTYIHETEVTGWLSVLVWL